MLEREYLENFASNDVGFYGLEIPRISSLLIAQIMYLRKNRLLDTFEILDEIKQLEGVLEYTTSTKKPDCFKRKPLKGLMKTHFTNASYISKNLYSHFGVKYGGNKALSSLVSSAIESSKNMDEFIQNIAHSSTIGAISNREKSKSITGEWLVFQKYRGQNYYLTLAEHDEGDENIFRSVVNARLVDFPFLN